MSDRSSNLPPAGTHFLMCDDPPWGWRGMMLPACLAFLGACAVLGGCSRASRPERGPVLQSNDSATFSPSAPSPSAAAGLPSASGLAAGPAAGEPRYVGVVLARQAVSVAAESEGRVVAVAVRVGDSVARGAELATLAREEIGQDRAVAQAAVRAAAAEARRAELELERTHDRSARRDIHPELYADEEIASAHNAEQAARAALDSARARQAQEEARLRQLETRLSRTVLRAPIDGRVAARFLDPGASVHAGTPVIRLISSHEFLLRFAVPPGRAEAVRRGQPVEVRLDSLPLILSGSVSNIAPQIDPASQMVFVEADLTVPHAWTNRLQDGLVGRVTLHEV